ncbi:MAG: tyrosine-protein phosphatase [Pseudomonadota bacterium]
MPANHPTTPSAIAHKMILGLMPASLLPTPGLSREVRPSDWAVPVDPVVPGLPNLYRLSDQIYRAAQPDSDGFRALQDMGVRSVLSLRQTIEDAPLARGSALILARVAMKSRYVGESNGARVVQAMRELHAALQRGPVLVHCHHGADRTGLICALWRILYQGWSRQSAIDEVIEGGYGFHPIWSNILRYVRSVDLVDLRDRIGA